MSELRKAAQQALEALGHQPGGMDLNDLSLSVAHAAKILRGALAQPEPKPLTEAEFEPAFSAIWRNLPYDFNYADYGWIEQGIRYAERKHGIGDKE